MIDTKVETMSMMPAYELDLYDELKLIGWLSIAICMTLAGFAKMAKWAKYIKPD